LAGAFLGANSARGEVRLPEIVGDAMVLQRDAKLVIWGWADPGEQVHVEFQNRQFAANAAADGKWRVTVGPFGAGGPFDMTVAGRNTIRLHNILVGDVWLASGQSNMEFPLTAGEASWMTGVINAASEAAAANYPQIRLFHVRHKIALKPMVDVEAAGWTAVTPETVGSFSALAYLYGRELFGRYHVPVGLIESSWGGTVAEAWVGGESLKPFPEIQEVVDSIKGIDEVAALAKLGQFQKDKAAWYAQHANEDRGRVDGRDPWADMSFDASSWTPVAEPQTKVEDALKGYDGTVWYRREFNLAAAQLGASLIVHLTAAGKHDVTFFNGEKVGETTGWDKPRAYLVPARLVKAGRNVIVIRQTGDGGYSGLFGPANDFYVQIGETAIPLAGTWSYQPGPDLTAYPERSAFDRYRSDPNTPTVLYNGMIAPLIAYRVKGVIWYQGESNAADNRSAQYRKLFPALIEDWRARWGYRLPFLFVQLAGYGPNEPDPAEYSWADLREAQSMALSLPDTGMATAVDIGDAKDIHPRNKQELARRLALVAAKVVYGEDVVSSGPRYRSMTIEGSRIRIEFSDLGSGLIVNDKDGQIRGFEIAGADGRFVWAQARRDRDDVVVFNQTVQKPVAVRYDWRNTPDGNLYNREGFPATPFRTDAMSAVSGAR